VKKGCIKTSNLQGIGIFNLGGAASVGLMIVGVVAILEMSLPNQTMSVQPVKSEAEIIALNDLKILNSGLTSITLDWSRSPDSTEIATYKIYMGGSLLDTVDGSAHTYTITKLHPGIWYQFHVDACNLSGKCSNGGPVVGGRTLTVQQASEAIIDKIRNLVSTGALTAAQGDSLIKNLAAVCQMNQDNHDTTELQAFINSVNSLISRGVLSQEAGQSLIGAADDIIRNII